MKKVLQSIGNLFNLVVLTKDELTEIKEETPSVASEKPTTLLTYSEIVSMLKAYDDKKLVFNNETNSMNMASLKHEDTRVITFDFNEIKNYLIFVEQMAIEKNITLKGLSFIKGIYNEKTTQNKDFIGYENLMYLPTTIIDNKETLIDIVNSNKDEIVTFDENLRLHGYEWRYGDNTNTFKNKENNSTQKSLNDPLSGIANVTTIGPPMPKN